MKNKNEKLKALEELKKQKSLMDKKIEENTKKMKRFTYWDGIFSKTVITSIFTFGFLNLWFGHPTGVTFICYGVLIVTLRFQGKLYNKRLCKRDEAVFKLEKIIFEQCIEMDKVRCNHLKDLEDHGRTLKDLVEFSKRSKKPVEGDEWKNPKPKDKDDR